MHKAWLLLLLAAPGCFAQTNSAATASYARQVAAASLRVAQIEEQVVQYQGRIEQLEEVIRVQGQSQQQRLENLDQVVAEVRRLRGDIDVAAFQLQETRTKLEGWQIQQERRQLHDEARLRQLEKFLNVTPPPPPTDAELGLTGTQPSVDGSGNPVVQPEPVPVVPEPALPADAKGKLALAQEHLDGGRPAVARVILTKALEDHKNDPLVPEIRYRLGDSWFAEQNWRKAGGEYRVINESFADSKWAPWAMLKLGDCFQGMGQKDNAKLFWEGVVAQFARTDAAKEAKKRLSGQ